MSSDLCFAATIEALIECCESCSRYFDTHRAVESERLDPLVKRLLKQLECLPEDRRANEAAMTVRDALATMFHLNRWYISGRPGQPEERVFICTTPPHLDKQGQPDFIGLDFSYGKGFRGIVRAPAWTAYRVIPTTFVDNLSLAVKLLRTVPADQEATDESPAADIGGRRVVPSRWWRCVWSVGLSVFLIAAFLGVVHLLPWPWMRDHKNAVTIQVAACVLFVLGPMGWFFPSTRKWAWSTGGLGAAAVLAKILDVLS